MKRVMLVDDDPVVLRIYQDWLSQRGMQVDTAPDGLAAISALRASKPDVVVLDLMMPKLTGVDVLKFIRSEENLEDLPVVVLSNSYMNQLAAEAATLGVQKALLKVRCSPSVLLGTINEVLTGEASGEDASHLLAVPDQSPAAGPSPTGPDPAGRAAPAPAPGKTKPTTDELNAKARHTFLRDARATCTALRSLCQAVIDCAQRGRAQPVPAGFVSQGPFHHRRCRPGGMPPPGTDGQRVRGAALRARRQTGRGQSFRFAHDRRHR